MKTSPGPYTTEPELLLFRRRLAALMRSAGMTQEELAARIGQTPRSVGLWLSGVRVPSAVSLKALSRVFGIPSDWLLGTDAVEIEARIRNLCSHLIESNGTDWTEAP